MTEAQAAREQSVRTRIEKIAQENPLIKDSDPAQSVLHDLAIIELRPAESMIDIHLSIAELTLKGLEKMINDNGGGPMMLIPPSTR